MQRKPLVVRQTAMSLALLDAAKAALGRGDTLPAAVSAHVPQRALKREPTWTVSRRAKKR